MRAAAGASLAVGLVLALSGCSTPVARTTAAATPAAAPTTTPPTSPVRTATPRPTPVRTRPAAPSAPLSVRTTHVTGHHGRTTYRLALPVFSGPLAEEATRRVRRSALDGMGDLSGAGQEFDSEVDVDTEVTRNDGRTVQVLLTYVFMADGAAHPTDATSTVVLRRSDMRPVLLTDVLTDVRPALSAALRHASQVAGQGGYDDPAQTLSPTLADWADWQAGPSGLRFSFDDYQAGSHASGLREVEVPWSVVMPWVAAPAYHLLGPG